MKIKDRARQERLNHLETILDFVVMNVLTKEQRIELDTRIGHQKIGCSLEDEDRLDYTKEHVKKKGQRTNGNTNANNH
jgi:hypothetical protein